MTIKDLLKDAYKEGMTLDEINVALENIELPVDYSAEVERLKKAIDKSNSEAATYKKQLREKMTDDEIKAKENADKMEELQSKYNALLRESNINNNKARLLALGYEDKLAADTAEAIVNGDLDKVFVNQKKHIESVEKKIREENLTKTPRPTGGGGSETMTLEKLRKMPLAEHIKFAEEHPEEYKALYGGN